MENKEHTEKHHDIGYGTYVLIWAALLVLTGLTVAIGGINFQAYSVAFAMIIASVKALLVLIFFMHLKTEDNVFRIFVLIAFIALLIFMVFIFFDYSNIR